MVSCKQGTFLSLGLIGIIFGALTIGLYSMLYDAILKSVVFYFILQKWANPALFLFIFVFLPRHNSNLNW